MAQSPPATPSPGQILTGPLFDEPMRVETVAATGSAGWSLGLVGTRSERFRKVSLGAVELAGLAVHDSGFRYDGDGALLRLGLQAHALGIAWEFDPYFGLSVSRVDPLPHQLEAVYDHLLKLPRVRFLLADAAGAGKTIMAGLLIRELQLRGLAERIPIVAPSELAFQWQRELEEKFDETFVVLKGGDLRAQYGVNQWLRQPQVVTSLDLAKREDILPGLRQAHWDLVVVDEAHRMSARDDSHKSQRYRLGELLRDSSDHMLLLTATPHKGDPGNFSLFLQLLDRDAYADVRSVRQAMDAGRAPFYLRRTKEAMVCFPARDQDGRWVARKIFTKRIPATVDFAIDGPEFALYSEVTRFVKRQSARAAAAGDDRRARAVGFLMALYQRRLTSSARAIRRSLSNRADRLERGLARAEDLARTAPPDLPSVDELDELEEHDRERLERLLDAVTLAGNAGMVRDEIAELRAPAVRAEDVEHAGIEAKLARLENLLRGQGFFDRRDQRLVLIHGVQGHARLPRREARSLGLHGDAHSRRHEARQPRRAGHPSPRRAAVPRRCGPGARGHRGGGRRDQPAGLQHPLQLRPPVEPQPPRAAHGAHPPLRPATLGATTLDRVHTAMLQYGGRSNALHALLKAEYERGPDFQRLSNALSGLYPRGSEEKRLLDAMLLAAPR